jgi:membrane associated rhomboid family serine protease
MGALDWAKVVHQQQWWRLFSCVWLHAGLIHLVINMLSLLFIGIRLEQQFGFGKLHKVLNWYVLLPPIGKNCW